MCRLKAIKLTVISQLGQREVLLIYLCCLISNPIMFTTGRFLWSVWKGDSPEQVARAGLWSVSTGMSGAVLQIPRSRAQKILKDLAEQKGSRQELQELVKHWLLESDGVCARLVLYSSMNVKKMV